MDGMNNKDYVYAKKFTCPVCEDDFEDYIVRKSKLKYISSDVDLKAHYENVEPLLYDVLLCQHCGYAAPTLLFNKISSRAAQTILDKVTPHYKPRHYTDVRTVEEAIERCRLALVTAITKDSR